MPVVSMLLTLLGAQFLEVEEGPLAAGVREQNLMWTHK